MFPSSFNSENVCHQGIVNTMSSSKWEELRSTLETKKRLKQSRDILLFKFYSTRANIKLRFFRLAGMQQPGMERSLTNYNSLAMKESSDKLRRICHPACPRSLGLLLFHAVDAEGVHCQDVGDREQHSLTCAGMLRILLYLAHKQSSR